MQRRSSFVVALIGLSAVGATCKGSETTAPPTTTSPAAAEEPLVRAPAVTELEGVDLFQVPSSERAAAIRILNESFCHCGCARTVAACLGNREQCSCVQCSERVAQFVIDSYALGMTTGDVESALVEAFSESYNARPFAFDLEGQPSLGNPDAPHMLVEFADFRCPHCKDAFGELVRFVQSREDVRLVYYFFPLSGFGEESVISARAAEAARRQGKFWEMATVLYANQLEFTEASVRGYAQELGLDMDDFEEDFTSEDVRSVVFGDKALGAEVGVQGTPAVYVDGRPLGMRHSAKNLALRLDMENDREACN
ncbi:MAG: thioredoxin domain-containing protein [Myxococcota bacterium]